MRKTAIIIALLLAAGYAHAASVLVEAEGFAQKGGWVVDQQFMDLMGSPYLLAHGMGVPVGDAATTAELPEKGTFHVWVRTYNWTSPWFDGEGPGGFTLSVGGKKLSGVLGTHGNNWMWQHVGTAALPKGATTLALHDLTGFDGRCDAIYLTTDPGEIPPNDMAALTNFRNRMLNITECPDAVEEFDLVVVGGGIAGMCAAVTAARLGCTVALINDRPLLGGNNSSEVRVHLGGSIEVGPNEGLGRMIREFGHSGLGNAQPADNYEDGKKEDFIAAEENITLYANYRAVDVKMSEDGKRIESVVIQHVETGERRCLGSNIFSDCTGDGTIGYLAGADWRMGREGRDEFGEDLAPEAADNMTMGASVQWYSTDAGKRVKFPHFDCGLGFNTGNAEKVTMGEWHWETGMNLDQIIDAERIRDYGLAVVYSNWSFLKNDLADNEKYRDRTLGWVAYVAGKRESRRLLGDYILKQDDIDGNVFHEDRSFTATWSIDLHFPDPVNTERFPGREFKAATKHIYIYPYAAPYRCLYSRNIDNLFMAGRNISVTHVALGTVRVMRTTGMMGEVVGMAASICNEHGVSPREVYQRHLPELKRLMKQGIGKNGMPDNQRFNESKFLDTPKGL